MIPRRTFLRQSGLGALGLVTGLRPGSMTRTEKPGKAPKNILVLGGTGFIGPHMVRYAVERGHTVSIFTRGRSDADLPPGVERLVGDRADDLSALEGRSWDVVLDNNTQDYRWAELSTALLREQVGQYLFVSSISAYDSALYANSDRNSPVMEPVITESSATNQPPDGWRNGDDAPYGL